MDQCRISIAGARWDISLRCGPHPCFVPRARTTDRRRILRTGRSPAIPCRRHAHQVQDAVPFDAAVVYPTGVDEVPFQDRHSPLPPAAMRRSLPGRPFQLSFSRMAEGERSQRGVARSPIGVANASTLDNAAPEALPPVNITAPLAIKPTAACGKLSGPVPNSASVRRCSSPDRKRPLTLLTPWRFLHGNQHLPVFLHEGGRMSGDGNRHHIQNRHERRPGEDLRHIQIRRCAGEKSAGSQNIPIGKGDGTMQRADAHRRRQGECVCQWVEELGISAGTQIAASDQDSTVWKQVFLMEDPSRHHGDGTAESVCQGIE